MAGHASAEEFYVRLKEISYEEFNNHLVEDSGVIMFSCADPGHRPLSEEPRHRFFVIYKPLLMIAVKDSRK